MRLSAVKFVDFHTDRGPSPFLPSWIQQNCSVILVVIILLAVGVRVVSAFLLGDTVAPLPGTYDQISYDTLARQVLAGKGFTFPTDWWPATRAGEPTAHWSYLYTLYLSAVYAVTGLHPLAARLIQAVVAGILHPWLAWRIGRRLGPGVGLVAAALTASYAYFIYYAGALMTETFYILAILWAIDLATGVILNRSAEGPGGAASRRSSLRNMRPWLFLGLALGIAVTLREVFLIFVPFLFGWILWSYGFKMGTSRFDLSRFRSALGGLIVSTLLLLALVLPWTVHNYQSFGRFVLLNTNSGYAFFWANHPIHGTDFVSILPSNTYRDLIPVELDGLDEPGLGEALMSKGVRFVVDDPIRYIRLSFSRIKDYFAFVPSPESGVASGLARVVSFGALFPFMILGLLLSVVGHRWRGLGTQTSTAILLYGFVVAYTLIHLLSWALVRYRLPVDAILVIFAAFAVVRLVAWLSDPWSSRGRKEWDSTWK